MRQNLTIHGGNIVTPQGIVENGTIVIENGLIADIRPSSLAVLSSTGHDAQGLWVLPGMIDTHSDAIEHEMQPRPTSRFALDFSYFELERKLVSQGVTTIYHSLSMWGENSTNDFRKNQSVEEIVTAIGKLRKQDRLIHHRVHIRIEMTNESVVPFVEGFIKDGLIDQISFMDHTPGQGQYRNTEVQKKFIMDRQKKTEEEVIELLEERKNRPKINSDQLQKLADMAFDKGIPLASHDDDTIEKLDRMQQWRGTISEFPVDLEVAVEAKRRGLYVVMGAPNVMLGRSHSNNLSAQEAVKAGVVDILCSDYYPPAMLRAVFLLHKQGLGLVEAVNMVSLNPAKALNIDHRTGSIEIGKEADLLIVKEHNHCPIIEKVLVHGQVVCQMDYLKGLTDASVRGAERIEA
ncbi:phosphonate metabolism protein PhnM [Paenibacillus prosopidis]|uniref:Alpha-D-ribose 1-methylphosphonate 5-triphosphate diphosphatase n=1 Tax=Paenibacillus prosopidis TaxID=630520 RepID=A0A368W835_9BACL|nr:phosphonate metabolism protein PhnM [Paenibacillus prosopidis]RCW51729.1 alpha-D-ribose 1-methylphosphonate 5-triphosphate diphosphatase [Paenibacillus prosopidis]